MSVNVESAENREEIIEGLKSQSWTEGVEPNSLFQAFLTEVYPRISLAATSYQTLEAFINVDVTAEKIGSYLTKNQYYEDMYLRVIQALGREELPSTNAAVVLLGMQRSRNFIVALQLFRTVYQKHPEVSAEGKLDFKPEDYLKFALKTEETAVNMKDRYADTAYAAGLIFDYLNEIAVAKELDESVQSYIAGVYGNGLKAAKVGKA